MLPPLASWCRIYRPRVLSSRLAEDYRSVECVPGVAKKPVSYCAKPGQDLKLEKECVVSVDSAVDPIKMERVSTRRVRYALAQEDYLVAGLLKMAGQFGGEILRRAVGLTE